MGTSTLTVYFSIIAARCFQFFVYSFFDGNTLPSCFSSSIDLQWLPKPPDCAFATSLTNENIATSECKEPLSPGYFFLTKHLLRQTPTHFPPLGADGFEPSTSALSESSHFHGQFAITSCDVKVYVKYFTGTPPLIIHQILSMSTMPYLFSVQGLTAHHEIFGNRGMSRDVQKNINLVCAKLLTHETGYSHSRRSLPRRLFLLRSLGTCLLCRLLDNFFCCLLGGFLGRFHRRFCLLHRCLFRCRLFRNFLCNFLRALLRHFFCGGFFLFLWASEASKGGDAGACAAVGGDGSVDCKFGRLCGSTGTFGSAGRGDGMEGIATGAGLGVGMGNLRTRGKRNRMTCGI